MLKMLIASLLTLGSFAKASNLQCRNLFVKQVINSSDISSRLNPLVQLFYQIESKDFVDESSLKQAADYLNNQLNLIHSIDPKYIQEFKDLIAKNAQSNKIDQEKKQKEKSIQKEIRTRLTDPAEIAQKAIMHEIKPGKFKMGKAKVETEITKPFAMMSVLFTQMMWARVKIAAGATDLAVINPSQNKGDHSIKVDGMNLFINADHPVEQVSWNDINILINELNTFSKSASEKDQTFLKSVFPDHRKGDIYDLPQEEQWEFVIKNRGNANKNFVDRDDSSEILDYAWVWENTAQENHAGEKLGSHTNAVATRKPRMVDGKAFYDLEGNVWEWMKDVNQKPPNPWPTAQNTIRGGGYMNGADQIATDESRTATPSEKAQGNIGFRLVRTRP